MFTLFKDNQFIRFSHVTFKTLVLTLSVISLIFPMDVNAQRKRAPGGGPAAVVVDERLAVLRDEPSLSAHLLQRLSRGRPVSIINVKRSHEGVTFYRVAVTSRTRGWLQMEAVVSPARKGDDQRLLNLIRASNDFDRIARACIFIEVYPRSALRPTVLLLLGIAAEEAAIKLSNEAARRLDENEMNASGALPFSYLMNFSGLDRYRRQGLDFTLDNAGKQFHYNGASWREIVRRYPGSTEAGEARKRLGTLAVVVTAKRE